jgi:hypothetical protein
MQIISLHFTIIYDNIQTSLKPQKIKMTNIETYPGSTHEQLLRPADPEVLHYSAETAQEIGSVELQPELAEDSVPREGEPPLQVMERLVQTETLLDQANFLRKRFYVRDPSNPDIPSLSVEFRGREELPVTSREPGDIHVVLTRDTMPLHTGMDRYGAWAETVTDSQNGHGIVLGKPTGDNEPEKVWGIAADNNSNEVIMHGLATPEGVVDVALQLVGAGVGSSEAAARLVNLREELSSRNYSDDSYKLMDELFAVCYELGDGSPGETSYEDGLMLTALHLAGSTEASEAVARAEEDFKFKKIAYDLGAHATWDYVTNETQYPENLAEAGEPVDPEIIAEVKEAGLVAVHTTEVRPLLGGKILRSTAEFGVGTSGQFPRDSVHFSLNHAVTSHNSGDFSGRPFTIVAPMGGMLENNGAPRAMADVDTYFMTSPSDGLILPEDTVIIELVKKVDDNIGIVQSDGSWIINTEILHSPAGVEKLAAEVSRLSVGGETSISDPVKWLASELERSAKLDIDLEKRSVDWINDEDDFFNTFDTEKQAELLAKKTDIKNIHDAFVEGGDIRSLLENQDLLASNDTWNKLLTESIRVILVAAAIRKQGGQVVEGGAHYTFDSRFQNMSNKLAAQMGVSTGLHGNSPEAWFEKEFAGALAKAQEKIIGPDGETHVTDFDWTKYSSSNMWGQLSKCPPQTRQRAMAMGILTHSPKKMKFEANDNII